MKRKSISRIANYALDDITNGQFPQLPALAITGLLNDFQYAWLRRMNIPYKFEMLDLARSLCNAHNTAVFRVTECKHTANIRNRFSEFIDRYHNEDDRVIISLTFDGRKINSEWVELKEYLGSKKELKTD